MSDETEYELLSNFCVIYCFGIKGRYIREETPLENLLQILQRCSLNLIDVKGRGTSSSIIFFF